MKNSELSNKDFFFKQNTMNIRISLLFIVVLTISVCVGAQTARNPLNHEPARITIIEGFSSWKLSEEMFYRADGVHIDKSLFAYDENGQKISHTTMSWNERENLWQNSSKTEYIKGESKDVSILSVGNITGWQYSAKTETIYDSDGKRTYSLTYSWDNNIEDWSVAPSLKCEWIYDENGYIKEYLKIHPDTKTNELNIIEAHILYSFDKDGELIEELYQSWNEDSKSWISRGKYTYSRENKTQKVAMSYFYASNKWVFDGKVIYSYDDEGKLTRIDYYGNNPDQSLSAYSLYAYSENKCQVISETADINIYPNPVISSFELMVPGVFVGKTASIFDVYGKFVKSIVVNYEKMQVDVNGFLGGIYVLHIGDKTKKFVIK